MDIIRTVVNAPTRKLKATWTIEEPLELYHAMDEEVVNRIVKALEGCNDWEIKKSLMPTGWVIRSFAQPIDPNWLSENMKHGWTNYAAEYAFEDPADASWAILRWG